MPDRGPFVLMTVELPGRVTLRAAARRLGIAERHLDAKYGIVSLDPDNALFTVRVSAEGAAEAGSTTFSDPKIRPMR
ncbi:MAG: hypothetical protein QM698_01285 [Micropepsaceae bacterium]